MKVIYTLFVFISLGFTSLQAQVQAEASEKVYLDKSFQEDTYVIPVSKKVLLNLSFNNDNSEDDVLSFKVKVKGQATILNEGHVLNEEIKSHILSASTGTEFVVFDIFRKSKKEEDALIFKIK